MKSYSLRFFPLALVLFAGLFASCSTPAAAVQGCDDPRPILVHEQETGLETCTGGAIHRSKIMLCPSFEPPAGRCQIDPTFPGSCGTNADCAKSVGGPVCGAFNDQKACSCTLACVNDAECGPGRMCRCDGIVAFCEKALCSSDADCAGGRLCLLTEFLACEPGQRQGFACQSELDECLTSFDCPGELQCGYDGDHRICVKTLCSP